MAESNQERTIDQLPNVSPEIQQIFQNSAEYVIPILERGRPFDLGHTFAVTYWAGQICINGGYDPEILIAAALFHDTGYTDAFKPDSNDSMDYDKIQDQKLKHMIISGKIVENFLKSDNYYAQCPEKIARIIQLVRNHDRIKEPELILKDPLLTALVEADTLGMIDVERVTPTFNKWNLNRFIVEELIPLRWPLMHLKFSKEVFRKLYKSLYNYYKNL